jgi:2,4-dienoyl-CoA reductase-like NADH-dependent reductase (Old Yellow Enzyme family)
MKLSDEFKLPCGAILSNRIAKSAMSEQLGNLKNIPTDELVHLYKIWSDSGAGLLITGNIMVNGDSLGEPRNVVLKGNEAHSEKFKELAGHSNNIGQHIWPQLNHPGRQALKSVSKKIVGPSVTKLSLVPGMFGEAKELTELEINNIIEDFVLSAKLSKEYGSSGVQIHAAHGYLISQFLSPLTNKRQDKWGGSIENRARFLTDIIKKIRVEVGDDFPIGVKINSADFQRGGFSEEDCLEVLKYLDSSTVDLIELSGGTYEAPAMVSGSTKESTKKREAYFMEFAEKAREFVSVPLMLTGGFRSMTGMNEALNSQKVDIIGIARPMVWDTHFPKKLLNGELTSIDCTPPELPVEQLKHMAQLAWFVLQIRNIGYGKVVDRSSNSIKEFIKYVGMSQKDALIKKLSNLF